MIKSVVFTFAIILSGFLNQLIAQKKLWLNWNFETTKESRASYYALQYATDTGVYFLEIYEMGNSKKSSGTYTSGKKPNKQSRHGIHTTYYSSGQIESQGWYNGENKFGDWVWYNTDGTISEQKGYDEDQKLNGHYFSSFPNGTPFTIANYSSGKLTGQLKIYYPNGNLRASQKFETGELVDSSLVYFPNGAISDQVYFIDGKKNGLAQYYRFDGSLASQEYYTNGKLDSFRVFDEMGKDITSGFDTTLTPLIADWPGLFDETKIQRKINETLEYPPMAIENNISGKVTVYILATSEGTIIEMQTINKPLGWGLDEAALKAVQGAIRESINPVTQHNRISYHIYIIPIRFQLG